MAHNLKDSTLIIPEKGKVIPSKSNLDLMKHFKRKFKIIRNYGDKPLDGSEKEGTSYKNYTYDPPSTSAVNGDKASPDKRDDFDKGHSATLRTNADDYSMEEGSAADKLDTVSRTRTTEISDDSELRKHRRREKKLERAKRSRSREKIYVFPEREKLQAKIEALKADSHALCKQLKDLSEECVRIGDENQLIMDKVIQKYGSGAILDLKDSFSELFDEVTSK